MENVDKPGKEQGVWLKVFCPDARCLSEEEIMDLPAEKKDAAESGGRQGLWLEVFCPDKSCLADVEKVQIPVHEDTEKESKGFWLNLFCPDDRCIAEDKMQLP